MILVDIQVPMLDKVYDFELNEERKVKALIEEILLLMAREERLICRDKDGICLYVLGRERLLDKDKSLKEQGVRGGDRLILF